MERYMKKSQQRGDRQISSEFKMPVTVSRDNNSVLGLAELLMPHTIPPALTRELVTQCEFSKEPAPPSELPKFRFVTWHASCQYSFCLALSFCLFL